MMQAMPSQALQKYAQHTNAFLLNLLLLLPELQERKQT